MAGVASPQSVSIAQKTIAKQVMDVFGGENGFNALPSLSDKVNQTFDRQTGVLTQQIDFLKPTDMPRSIMGGTDSWERPFVALKVTNQSDPQKPVVLTLYQRYSDDPNIWSQAVDGHSHTIQTCEIVPWAISRILKGKHAAYRLVPEKDGIKS